MMFETELFNPPKAGCKSTYLLFTTGFAGGYLCFTRQGRVVGIVNSINYLPLFVVSLRRFVCACVCRQFNHHFPDSNFSMHQNLTRSIHTQDFFRNPKPAWAG